MYVDNRVIALIYRVFSFLLGSIAIVYDFGIFDGQFKSANFLYFTIISNLFCIIFFGILIIKTLIDIKNFGIWGSSNIFSHLRGGILISILLTMSVYHFILIPYALKINPYQHLKLVDIIFHYIIPFLTLFDWILFDEKGGFKLYDPIFWTIGPYIYLVFIFMQSGIENTLRVNAHMNKYIYAFLDVDLIGISQVMINIFSLTIVFIVVGYIVCLFDRIKISE